MGEHPTLQFSLDAHEQEKCIILVTHEKEVANASDEVYVLKNQQLTKQADSQ